MRVCVYCGSSPGADPAFATAARRLGRGVADRGWGLVYGGASVGLMGVVADAALAAGGEVHGVVPVGMAGPEVAHRGLTALDVVPTMAARKDRMAALADAFVVLPGGLGTLDELFETWTLHHLGQRTRPIGLLDVAGFFGPLLAMVEAAVGAGFVSRRAADALAVDSDVDALLGTLGEQAEPPLPGDALDVVCWVLVRDGALLVARSHGSDAFYAPGGKVEPGETEVAAVVREVREELGVDLDPLTVAPLTEVHAPAHGRHAGRTVRLRCLTGQLAEGSADPTASGEVSELRWVHAHDPVPLAPADVVLRAQLAARGLMW